MSNTIPPTVKAIQEAMNRFARAHMLLGSASDRDPADKALCDAIKDHAAAVSAAKDAEIEAHRQAQAAVYLALGSGNPDRDTWPDEIRALRERVRVLEDAAKHYEAALAAAWPQGAMGKSYERWNAARIVRAALEKASTTLPPLPSPPS